MDHVCVGGEGERGILIYTRLRCAKPYSSIVATKPHLTPKLVLPPSPSPAEKYYSFVWLIKYRTFSLPTSFVNFLPSCPIAEDRYNERCDLPDVTPTKKCEGARALHRKRVRIISARSLVNLLGDNTQRTFVNYYIWAKFFDTTSVCVSAFTWSMILSPASAAFNWRSNETLSTWIYIDQEKPNRFPCTLSSFIFLRRIYQKKNTQAVSTLALIINGYVYLLNAVHVTFILCSFFGYIIYCSILKDR